MADMTVELQDVRHTDVVYVVAKLRIGETDCVLLNAHRKWGDWSLVGGHVEQTDPDWRAAAAREVHEEMAPLRCGDDLELEPLKAQATEWGPVLSVSAGGKPTCYRARWFLLRFLADPGECLAQLSPTEFRLFRLSELETEEQVSSVVQRAASLVGGWRALPFSWGKALDKSPLLGSNA
jgi:hypothetical protein